MNGKGCEPRSPLERGSSPRSRRGIRGTDFRCTRRRHPVVVGSRVVGLSVRTAYCAEMFQLGVVIRALTGRTGNHRDAPVHFFGAKTKDAQLSLLAANRPRPNSWTVAQCDDALVRVRISSRGTGPLCGIAPTAYDYTGVGRVPNFCNGQGKPGAQRNPVAKFGVSPKKHPPFVERISDGENANVPAPQEGEVAEAHSSEHLKTAVGRQTGFRAR